MFLQIFDPKLTQAPKSMTRQCQSSVPFVDKVCEVQNTYILLIISAMLPPLCGKTYFFHASLILFSNWEGNELLPTPAMIIAHQQPQHRRFPPHASVVGLAQCSSILSSRWNLCEGSCFVMVRPPALIRPEYCIYHLPEMAMNYSQASSRRPPSVITATFRQSMSSIHYRSKSLVTFKQRAYVSGRFLELTRSQVAAVRDNISTKGWQTLLARFWLLTSYEISPGGLHAEDFR